MLRKQIKFGWLVGAVVLVGCHSSTNKKATDTIEHKDTANVAVSKPVKKEPPEKFLILDTIVKKDTIKVLLYGYTMMRCSINRLADTFNAQKAIKQWDESYVCTESMLIPGKKNPVKFILNDSVFIISVSCGYMAMDGAVELYMVNRKRRSIKFAGGENPVVQYPAYMYVDLKRNTILTYYCHEIYDDEPDAGDEQHGRFLIDRYRVHNKQFEQTGKVASYYPAFEQLDLDSTPNLKAFYNAILRQENWKRDRYDSANYQRIVVLDTIAGKDTIRLSYDNKGNVIARINRESDTIQWDETWLGYEYWRGKEDNQLIMPGKMRPDKVILNDSLLVFTIEDKYQCANLFYIKRAADTFDIRPDILSTEASYLYIDLKKNEIIEQAGRKDGDYDAGYGDDDWKKIPFTVNRYRLGDSSIDETHSIKLLSKELNEIRNPNSYQGAKAFYKIAKQPKNWEHDKYNPNAYQKVIVVDTIVGKDTIKVSYDNKGTVTGTLNGNSQSGMWIPWKGYQWWRGKADAIIVPGETKPRAFILNDTLLIVTIMDSYQNPVLFFFKRTPTSLNASHSVTGVGYIYIYVDLKTNTIIDNFGQDSQDYMKKYKRSSKDALPNNLPYWIYRYKITRDSLQLTDKDTSFFKDFLGINDMDSYYGSKAFYDIIAHREDWKRDKYTPHSH